MLEIRKRTRNEFGAAVSNKPLAAGKNTVGKTYGESVCATIAPPDMYNRQKDSGKSMAELFESSGVKLTRADNSRIQGWMNLKEWLKVQKNEDGKCTARLHISKSSKELIRCLPQLMHDKDLQMDAATEPHDITHICDALRYLCMYRTGQSSKKVNKSFEEKYKDRAIRACRQGAGGAFIS